MALGLFVSLGAAWSLFVHVGIWQKPVGTDLAWDGFESAVTWPLELAQLLWFMSGGDI